MKKLTLLMLLFASLFVVTRSQTYKYPLTRTQPVTDKYFGTTVTDEYRWLEDLKNPEVQQWFKGQADFTSSVLDKVPGRQKLADELVAYNNMVTVSYQPVAKAGGRYFYQKRSPGEQVFKLYYRQGADGKETLLFDPQKFVEGKTFDFSPDVSFDGSKVLLNLIEAGSELGDIRVLDVATAKFLPDVVAHSNGGFLDGSNTEILFFEYKSYDTHDPQNNLNLPFKLHVLGQPAASDIELASSKKYPDLIQASEYPVVVVDRTCPYIFLLRATVENNQTIYFAPKTELKAAKISWKPLTVKADEVRNFFVSGSDIYLLTTKGNPSFSITKTNLDKPDLQNAKAVFEGTKEWQLSPDFVSNTKDYLFVTKTKNELVAKSFALEFKTGKVEEINVPLKGNVYAQAANKDDNEVNLVNRGWNIPANFYSYDARTKNFSKGLYYVKKDFPNLENIVFEEVEVPSHDGTLVPLSIVYDKVKLKKDGSNAAFMTGYGAYGINAYTPAFGVRMLPLLNRGVVLAYAHIRGGGEKGNDWYLAGKKTTKPNTWKDLNASAELLIKNKYTSAEKLGITGGSAGGILIGRAITERPDLYKVAIPKVGCLNTLRMEFSPNGPANIPEFGTVTIEEEFKALLEMDAMHHVRKGVKYPAQLITTGFNDPRVESYIPAKFAAAMQANNASNNPTLLYVDYKAGHFGGSTLDEQFAQTAMEYAFLLWQAGDPEFQPRQ